MKKKLAKKKAPRVRSVDSGGAVRGGHKHSKTEAEPMPEFDFSKGVRGKYVDRYRAARVTVQLDPDVAQEFPDSASFNEGLRALLRLRRGESTI